MQLLRLVDTSLSASCTATSPTPPRCFELYTPLEYLLVEEQRLPAPTLKDCEALIVKVHA
jgi:hypothetical protein